MLTATLACDLTENTVSDMASRELLTAGVLIWAVLSYAPIDAAVDCTKPPSYRFKEVKDCCPMPQPIWQYPQCDKYKTSKDFACLMDCVFNVTGVREDDDNTFNMGKLRTLLVESYPQPEDLSRSMLLSFERCNAKWVQRKARVGNSQRNNRRIGSVCDKSAFQLSVCASKQMFIDCPDSLWVKSDMCNSAREYARMCGKENGGRFSRSGSARVAGGVGGAGGIGGRVRIGGRRGKRDEVSATKQATAV